MKCRIIKVCSTLHDMNPLRRLGLLVLGFMARTNGTAVYLANFRHMILVKKKGFSAEDISHVFIGDGFTWGDLVSRLDHASHSMGEPTEKAIREMCSLV